MPNLKTTTLFMKFDDQWVEMAQGTQSVEDLLASAKKLLPNKQVMVMDAAGTQHYPKGEEPYFDLWDTIDPSDAEGMWYRTGPAMTVNEAVSGHSSEVFIRSSSGQYLLGDKDGFRTFGSSDNLMGAKKLGDALINERYKNQNLEVLADAGLDPSIWVFSDSNDIVMFTPIGRIGHIFASIEDLHSDTLNTIWVVSNDSGNPIGQYLILRNAADRLLEESEPVLKDAHARCLAAALTNLLTDIQSTGTPTHMVDGGISGAIDDANQLLADYKLPTVEIPMKGLVYGVFDNSDTPDKLTVEGEFPEQLKPLAFKKPSAPSPF